MAVLPVGSPAYRVPSAWRRGRRPTPRGPGTWPKRRASGQDRARAPCPASARAAGRGPEPGAPRWAATTASTRATVSRRAAAGPASATRLTTRTRSAQAGPDLGVGVADHAEHRWPAAAPISPAPTTLPANDGTSRRPSPVTTRSAPARRSGSPTRSATRSKPGTMRPPRAASPPASPPAAPAPGRPSTSTPKPSAVALGQGAQTLAEQRDLGRGGPLLGPKTGRRVGEGGRHVTGHQQLGAVEGGGGADGGDRPPPAVGGGRAPAAHDHGACAGDHGGQDQLADPGGVRPPVRRRGWARGGGRPPGHLDHRGRRRPRPREHPPAGVHRADRAAR